MILKQLRITRIFAAYYMLMAAIIVFLFNGCIFSLSVDLAHNYVLINKILLDNSITSGFVDNLGEMLYYPPLSHWLTAVFAQIFGTEIITAMNIFTLVAFIVIYYILSYWIAQTNLFTFIVFCLSFILLFLPGIYLPVFGYEIVKNCFYAQFIGQVFALIIMFLIYKYPIDSTRRFVALISAIVLCSYIHLLPTLILIGASIIIIVLESYPVLCTRQKAIELGVFSVVFAMVAILNPYVTSMSKIAENNGGLRFPLIAHSGDSLSIGAYLIIAISLILSAWCLFNKHGSAVLKPGEDRVALFTGSLLFTSSFLALVQLFFMYAGYGSPYAVKKYFFNICMYLGLMVVILLGKRISSSLSNKRWHQKDHFYKYMIAAIPVFVLIISLELFTTHIEYETTDLIHYQEQVRNYQQYQNEDLHKTVAQFNIPPTLNYLLTISDLQYPRNEVAYKILSNSLNGQENEAYFVATDDDYNGSGVIYSMNGLTVVARADYFHE